MALPFFAGTLSRKRGNRSWNGVLLFISRMTANAICGLDNIPSGYDRRRLSAEWARFMAGTGVLIMVGTEALSMADTAVNRQFKDQ
ncbi:hypothetical protein IMY05_014G0078900 [Salix suchowensis]|nr:hypothetical protein IMY05_014G0078900 [Salix suchowensis]